MEATPNTAGAASSPSPIACEQCSKAKTGCDKKVPCSRCIEKGLACVPRTARRQSKSLRRREQTLPHNYDFAGPAPYRNWDYLAFPPPFGFERETIASNYYPVAADDEQAMFLQRTDFHPPFGQSRCDPFMEFKPGFSMLSPDQEESPNGMQLYPFADMGGWDYPLPPDNGPFTVVPSNEGACSLYGSVDTMSSLSEASLSMLSPPATTSPLSPNIDHRRPSAIPLNGHNQPAAEVPTHVLTIQPNESLGSLSCGMSKYDRRQSDSTSPRHSRPLHKRYSHADNWNALRLHINRIEDKYPDFNTSTKITNGSRCLLIEGASEFPMCASTSTYPETANEQGQVWSPHALGDNFLPAVSVLDFFVRVYLFEHAYHYWAEQCGCIDINDLAARRTTCPLALLMIAKGASLVLQEDAQCLSVSFSEASLTVLAQNLLQSGLDTTILHYAFLSVSMGLWSGQPRLTNDSIALGITLSAMLEQQEILDTAAQPSILQASACHLSELDVIWKHWAQREMKARAFYNWVLLDQEASIFYDRNTSISINNMRYALPSPEVLWTARDSAAWSRAVPTGTNPTSSDVRMLPRTQPSLGELYWQLKQCDIPCGDYLLQRHLRLLLYPILALIHHVRQVTRLCFSQSRPPSLHEHGERMKEPRILLQQWYQISLAQDQRQHQPVGDSESSRLNLTLYHFLWLNTVADFELVETCAYNDSSNKDPDVHHCIDDPVEARHHGAWALRLLRGMSPERRPRWWPLAVYRATLILWAESHITNTFRSTVEYQQHPEPFPFPMSLTTPAALGTQPPVPFGTSGASVLIGDDTPLRHHHHHQPPELEASLCAEVGPQRLPREPGEILALGVAIIKTSGAVTPMGEEVLGKLRRAVEIGNKPSSTGYNA